MLCLAKLCDELHVVVFSSPSLLRIPCGIGISFVPLCMSLSAFETSFWLATASQAVWPLFDVEFASVG